MERRFDIDYIFFDFEVFKYDTMAWFYNISTDEWVWIHNDMNAFKEYYLAHQEALWIQFNGNKYDIPIFKCCIKGMSNEEIFEVSYKLINQKGFSSKVAQIYKLYNMPIFTLDVYNHAKKDAAQDIETQFAAGLKKQMALSGLDIIESDVNFDIDRPLTHEEVEETKKYCQNDVLGLMAMFVKFFGNIQAVAIIIEKFKLEAVNIRYTMPRLAAIVFGLGHTQAPVENLKDELDPIYIPPEIRPQLPEHQPIIDFYTDYLSYKKSLVIEVGGIAHTFGFGGTHGAEYFIGRMLALIDANGFYPWIMRIFGLYPRHFSKEAIAKHHDIIDEREATRNTDKDLTTALKLFLNSLAGAFKDEYNPMYDPRINILICVYGQLILTRLIEICLPYSKLVQSNTDGIIVKPYQGAEETLKRLVDDYFTKLGFGYSWDDGKALIQDHVNRYILVMDGYTKSVGALFNMYDGGKDKNLTVVSRAVVDYFAYGTPPEKTIRGCRDITWFQQVIFAKKDFEVYNEVSGKDIKVQQVNRVFAAKNKKYGRIKKWSKKTGKFVKIGGTPEHAAVLNGEPKEQWLKAIDLDWYIALAKKEIKALEKRG